MRALERVTLAVRVGEFVSIVGPSGCGKSTLLSIIAGAELPTSGEVMLAGTSMVGRRDLAAHMPQKDLLFPWLSVLDNLALPLELKGNSRRSARREAASHLGHFGLEGFEQAWPWQLSGGMRQRAALLRTHLVGRPVVLLDEPFGALDALTRAEMQEWLLGVWNAESEAVLLVTHDVEEAIFLSDRVYVMSYRPGRIIAEVGVPFERPRTYHLYGDPRMGALKEQLIGMLRSAEIT